MKVNLIYSNIFYKIVLSFLIILLYLFTITENTVAQENSPPNWEIPVSLTMQPEISVDVTCPFDENLTLTFNFFTEYKYNLSFISTLVEIHNLENMLEMETYGVPQNLECVSIFNEGIETINYIVAHFGPWVEMCAHCNFEAIFDINGYRPDLSYYDISLETETEIYTIAVFDYGPKLQSLTEWRANLQ